MLFEMQPKLWYDAMLRKALRNLFENHVLQGGLFLPSHVLLYLADPSVFRIYHQNPLNNLLNYIQKKTIM